MNKKQIRNQLRQQRSQLNPHQLQQNSRLVCQRLARHPWIQNARHIALFMPNDGEPDITLLPGMQSTRAKTYYLPCLETFGQSHMVFRRWFPRDPLRLNRFDIPEPLPGKSFPVWALSVVLMPLVAFDRRGNRLGMGAGYYDRTLMLRKDNPGGLPRLIGVAHDFQQIECFQPNPWDVPLDLVVTEARVIKPEP